MQGKKEGSAAQEPKPTFFFLLVTEMKICTLEAPGMTDLHPVSLHPLSSLSLCVTTFPDPNLLWHSKTLAQL